MTLVAGDADFQPLVDAVGAEGTYVRLWSKRRSTAATLIRAADMHEELSSKWFLECLTEEFKLARSTPWESGEYDKHIEGFELVRRGVWGKDRRLAELYQGNTEALLIYQTETHYFHVKGANEQCVLNYAEDLHNIEVTWNA
jgi:hypothetical protein